MKKTPKQIIVVKARVLSAQAPSHEWAELLNALADEYDRQLAFDAARSLKHTEPQGSIGGRAPRKDDDK